MTRITAPDGSPSSPLAFGTMQFGGNADATESARMFRACHEAGINHFDTAHIYTDGRSEEILGGLIGPDRDGLIVATKVGYAGGAPDRIRTECETSLRRLRLDSVDLLYLHKFDPATPLEASLNTLAAVARTGLARAIGLSNFAAWQVMKAQGVLRGHGERVGAIQPMLNLVKRQAEVELLPMARDQGADVYPYSPLGGGLLTGKYAAGGTGRLTENDRYARRYGPAWMHETAGLLATIGQAADISPVTLAVAWAMGRPGVTAPIVSARSVAQLLPALDALRQPVDAAVMARVAAISPDPPPATDRLEEAG